MRDIDMYGTLLKVVAKSSSTSNTTNLLTMEKTNMMQRIWQKNTYLTWGIVKKTKKMKSKNKTWIVRT
ncbi:hypothetical protein MAR_016319 [Mya arenaria]|uniref:Uncharacterized protein n=1 Tax=Mya arenaria TaxID=6604 RepID=A0ABY7FJH6_MYAAR|nr:hypothetical protein MAR_016319 [Mya arenaria]